MVSPPDAPGGGSLALGWGSIPRGRLIADEETPPRFGLDSVGREKHHAASCSLRERPKPWNLGELGLLPEDS